MLSNVERPAWVYANLIVVQSAKARVFSLKLIYSFLDIVMVSLAIDFKPLW